MQSYISIRYGDGMALSHGGIAQHVKKITTKPNLHMEGEPSLQKVIESNIKSIRHTS